MQEIGSSKLREAFSDKYGYEGDNKDIHRFAMGRVLQRDALSALTTGFMLRSWIARWD